MFYNQDWLKKDKSVVLFKHISFSKNNEHFFSNGNVLKSNIYLVVNKISFIPDVWHRITGNINYKYKPLKLPNSNEF